MKRFGRTVLIVIAIAIGGMLLKLGYSSPWTGFGTSVNSRGEAIPAKTLWDWFDLLVVPFVLLVGAWILDGSRKNSDARVETDRQRQKTLEDYLAGMTTMLLEETLPGVPDSPARGTARTRTLAVLRSLDGGRKAQLLQFLYESGLIGPSPAVWLNGADLSDAQLNEAVLRKAELRGVHFERASFRSAMLEQADFRGSDFSRADFTAASVEGTNFTQANLTDATITNELLAAAITEQATLPKRR